MFFDEISLIDISDVFHFLGWLSNGFSLFLDGCDFLKVGLYSNGGVAKSFVIGLEQRFWIGRFGKEVDAFVNFFILLQFVVELLDFLLFFHDFVLELFALLFMALVDGVFIDFHFLWLMVDLFVEFGHFLFEELALVLLDGV